MNSKERMALAMQHKIADRVPVMCQLTLGHYFLNLEDKYKPHEIWFSSEGFADALVTLQQRYQFDGILINIPGRDPNWREMVRSIEETEDGEIITWKDDSQTFIPWDDNAQYESDSQSTVTHPDFLTFDPDKDIERLDEFVRYTWGVYHVPWLPGKAPGLLTDPPDYLFGTIDLVKAAVGDTVSVHGEVFSPFTHFMELFGYQNSLVALALDSGRAEAILERLSEATIAWGRAQAERGVDAVLISSAFVGGGFISPAMYQQFVVPYERKVTDEIHESHPGVPVYTHTCGRLNDRLEYLIETGTDGIDTLDPPPLGDIELNDAKQRIGDQAFIKGNMNSVALLEDTEEQVIDRAVSALNAGKPNGGYILSTACSVAPRVEPWKLEMLVDLAKEHGRYNEV